MQHPTITLILRYPNNTLQLASQEHLKNLLIIECENCHSKEIVDRRTSKHKCSRCDHANTIKAPSGMTCKTKNCNGSMKLFVSSLGILSYQCDTCGFSQTLQRMY